MTQVLPSRTVLVWSILIVATVATSWLGTDHGFDDIRLQTTAVLAIAVVKVRLVGLHFMGIGEAPRSLRVTFEAWCAVLLTGTVCLYLVL